MFSFDGDGDDDGDNDNDLVYTKQILLDPG